MKTDRQTDGRKDMTKLVTCRNLRIILTTLMVGEEKCIDNFVEY